MIDLQGPKHGCLTIMNMTVSSVFLFSLVNEKVIAETSKATYDYFSQKKIALFPMEQENDPGQKTGRDKRAEFQRHSLLKHLLTTDDALPFMATIGPFSSYKAVKGGI